MKLPAILGRAMREFLVTFFIPPPFWIAKELLHIDLPGWMKEVTGTSLDRKTLKTWEAGKATPRTQTRLASDFQKQHPEIAESLDAYRSQRSDIMAALGRHEEFEIENSGSTWRPSIELAVIAATKAGEPQFAPTILQTQLLPLEEASIRAEVLWKNGAFDEVFDLMAASVLAPFLDLDRLRQDAQSSKDATAFSDVFKPVRALACLYILAVWERQFHPRGNRPGFESILPRHEQGEVVTPMARLVEQLERSASSASGREARLKISTLDKADDASKLRRFRRWVKTGVFPEYQSFVTLVNSVGASRGFPAPDKRPVTFFYYAIRYLTTLGEMVDNSPVTDYFGDYNGFFDRYSSIQASLS